MPVFVCQVLEWHLWTVLMQQICKVPNINAHIFYKHQILIKFDIPFEVLFTGFLTLNSKWLVFSPLQDFSVSASTQSAALSVNSIYVQGIWPIYTCICQATCKYQSENTIAAIFHINFSFFLKKIWSFKLTYTTFEFGNAN